MADSVLISIKPKWCELIASGKKTVEVRKTQPAVGTPFKVYIYCTKDIKLRFWTGKRYSYADERSHNAFDKCGNGKVIGEFVCKNIDDWGLEDLAVKEDAEIALSGSGLTRKEVLSYLGIGEESPRNPNKYYSFYGWHISDLKIYDEPRELSEFCSPDTKQPLTRPPQSWCYVAERECVRNG